MSNTEVLIALLIVVGVPCATIIAVAWLFVRGIKLKDKP